MHWSLRSIVSGTTWKRPVSLHVLSRWWRCASLRPHLAGRRFLFLVSLMHFSPEEPRGELPRGLSLEALGRRTSQRPFSPLDPIGGRPSERLVGRSSVRRPSTPRPLGGGCKPPAALWGHSRRAPGSQGSHTERAAAEILPSSLLRARTLSSRPRALLSAQRRFSSAPWSCFIRRTFST